MNKETTQQEENNVHKIFCTKLHKIVVKDLVRVYPGYYFKVYCSKSLQDIVDSVDVLATKGDME